MNLMGEAAMNELRHAEPLSDVPWPTSDHRMPVANTSMLPGSEKAPSPAEGLLSHARQGAHDTLDRSADRAAPAAQRPRQGVLAARLALCDRKGLLREARDRWRANARTTVNRHPLVATAAAVTLGAVIARITRWGSSPS
jgi:hypothetical protein